MLTVLEVFQWCIYAIKGTIVLALCVCIVRAALSEIRKKWRGKDARTQS